MARHLGTRAWLDVWLYNDPKPWALPIFGPIFGVSLMSTSHLRLLRHTLPLIATALLSTSLLQAQELPPLVGTQTLYLPIYSHLYHGTPDKDGKPAETLTSAHVSIRNTDNRTGLQVTSARYYDTNGKLIREYVPSPKAINALGTLELFVPHTDVSGGSGANFIIVWSAESPINPPVVEAIHADIRASRSVVFVTTARQIRSR